MNGLFSSIECCKCHMIFGVSASFYKDCKDTHRVFYCPACQTPQSFKGISNEEKLRQERDRLTQKLAQKDDEIKRQREMRKDSERRVIAYKGVITKTKKRIAGGACPCCNRTFQNLARHMETQHKEYAHKDEVA